MGNIRISNFIQDKTYATRVKRIIPKAVDKKISSSGEVSSFSFDKKYFPGRNKQLATNNINTNGSNIN